MLEIRNDTRAGREILAHEFAHVEQYRRLGVAAFLYRYFADDFSARVRGAAHREAYLAIAFEREAREASGRSG